MAQHAECHSIRPQIEIQNWFFFRRKRRLPMLVRAWHRQSSGFSLCIWDPDPITFQDGELPMANEYLIGESAPENVFWFDRSTDLPNKGMISSAGSTKLCISTPRSLLTTLFYRPWTDVCFRKPTGFFEQDATIEAAYPLARLLTKQGRCPTVLFSKWQQLTQTTWNFSLRWVFLNDFALDCTVKRNRRLRKPAVDMVSPRLVNVLYLSSTRPRIGKHVQLLVQDAE